MFSGNLKKVSGGINASRTRIFKHGMGAGYE
jgi:hypothetical protein